MTALSVLPSSNFSVLTSEVQPGAGKLQFEDVRGKTVLTRAIAASPLRVLNPKNTGESAWVYLATYGGGLVGGDALDISIDVGRRAAALVATQASTKVYRSPLGASQRLHARAADGSLLVLLPDPVTAFAGSRYAQEQHVELDEAASLVLVDWLTAGRMASGERWQFDGYTSRTFVRRSGALLLHDAMSLTPGDGSIAGRMNRFNCVATVIMTGPAVQAAAARLDGEIGTAPLARQADMLMSAAPLAGGDTGTLVRVAGMSVEQVGGALRRLLNFVPSLLGDDPWSCKF
jgi:urease accessory protein